MRGKKQRGAGLPDQAPDQSVLGVPVHGGIARQSSIVASLMLRLAWHNLQRPGRLRRFRRLLALVLLQGQAEELTFRRDDITWTAAVSDLHVMRSLFVEGAYQRREARALLAWLRAHGSLGPDKTIVVDVGANIGTTAVPLARETGYRVLAVEPAPANVTLLRRNTVQNGLDARVTCLPVAISASNRENRESTIPLRLDPHNSGAAEVWEHAKGNMEEAVLVPTATLDTLVREQGVAPAAVACVWSDTQGYERHVIASGTTLWASGVPLFVELWPGALERHGGIAAFVDEAAQHFASLVISDDLQRLGPEAPMRPISGLPAILKALDPDDFSDVLLLPSSVSSVKQ